jgi:uncharacterized protein (TIGR03437 family)
VSTTKLVAVQVLTSGLQIGGIANSASYATDLVCSPGSLASIFGSGFTSGAKDGATTMPFPTELAGVRLDVDGVPAPLLYVSDQLINFQCPNADQGSSVTMVVKGTDGETAKVELTQVEASPGIFSINESGQGQGAVLVAGTSLIAGAVGPGSRPIHPGEYIEVFATGLGPTDFLVNPGTPAPNTKLIRAARPVSLTIGGEQLEPTFAGLAPGFVGLFQLNVQVPMDTSTGVAIPLLVNVTLSDGTVVTSNIVTIAIE